MKMFLWIIFIANIACPPNIHGLHELPLNRYILEEHLSYNQPWGGARNSSYRRLGISSRQCLYTPLFLENITLIAVADTDGFSRYFLIQNELDIHELNMLKENRYIFIYWYQISADLLEKMMSACKLMRSS